MGQGRLTRKDCRFHFKYIKTGLRVLHVPFKYKKLMLLETDVVEKIDLIWKKYNVNI